MKKLFKCFVIMVMLAVAVLVVSETDTYAAPKKAKNKVTYTLKKGTLTIKGKGKMPKSMTFEDEEHIKKVVIKKGVTSVCDYAFSGCKNLKTVKIANSVKEIGHRSFEYTGIKKVTVPKSVKKIGDKAFRECNKLVSITMPGNFKMKKIKFRPKQEIFLDYNVVSGKKFETVNFNTNFELETTEYIRGSKWNVSKNDPNYKSIDGVIYSKDGKDIIRVPKDATELVIAEGCETFRTESIYYRDVKLVKRWHNKKIHKTELEFYLDLQKITFSKTVKHISYEKTEGGYITSLSQLVIKDIVIDEYQLDTENVIKLFETSRFKDYGINTRQSLEELFPNRVKIKDDFYILDNHVLWKYAGQEEGVIIPPGIKMINKRVFYDRNDIKKVIIPEGVEIIGEQAFSEMNNLEEVVLQDGLKVIEDSAFELSRKLSKIKLPEGIKEIGENAFYYCDYLEEINFPNSLNAIEDNAFSSTGLKEIAVHKNITTWGKYAFAGTCIKEVELPNNMKVIPEGFFFGCGYLEKVKVSKNLTTIEDRAFMYTNVDIQSILNSKKLKKIGEAAFCEVPWRTLNIPKNITTIEFGAFEPLKDKKRTVTINGRAKNIDTNAFSFRWQSASYYKFIFKNDIKNRFTYVNGYITKSGKKVKVTCAKVKGARGYDIKIYGDVKKKSLLGKRQTKNGKTTATIKINKEYENLYMEVRPYKMVKGKKIYGRWTDLEVLHFKD